MFATATVDLVAANGSNTTGKLLIEQLYPYSSVIIKGEVQNLEQGVHGFHVHEIGATGNDCKDAGAHFNPTNVMIFIL